MRDQRCKYSQNKKATAANYPVYPQTVNVWDQGLRCWSYQKWDRWPTKYRHLEESFMWLVVLAMQKRYKWNKEKLNCLKKEEKETAFQFNVTTIWHFCPSGCRALLLMKEAPLVLCERPDFAEVSNGIPTEFNVSRSKPDKTRTVNSAKFWRGRVLPTEQTIWVVLNSPLAASVYVTRELGNITPVSQGSKSFRVFFLVYCW